MISFVQNEGRRYARFDHLRGQAGLVHAFSTRPMNVSAAGTAGAAAQRRLMAEDWGLDVRRLHYCQQVHRTNLAVVAVAEPGGPLPECDGVATAVAGAALMTFSADCPLVLAYDPVRHAVGMVHASWRCTVRRASASLIGLMMEWLGCRAADILAGVGPGAGPCCYEVQDDVYEAAADLPDRERFFLRRTGRLYFDLWQANTAQLAEAGVPAEHISTAGMCTICHPDVFYSYRREGSSCGHFALLAGLVAR